MITKKQFDFLLAFSEQSTSGSKYSESRIDAAQKYIFTRSEWEAIKPVNGNRECYTIKQYGKKLGEKILFWHEFLLAWPSDINVKFEALKETGGKVMADSVIKASIQHITTGDNANKCAVDNGCFMGSVKSALAKIDKFDKAAKDYGDL